VQFLVSLNEDYKIIRGSILMTKPLPNIDQVYSLVQQEEKQRALNAMSQFTHDSTAFHTNVHGQDTSMTEHTSLTTQQRSYNFQQKTGQHYGYGSNHNSGYNYKNMPRGGNQERKQLFCDFCKMTRHAV